MPGVGDMQSVREARVMFRRTPVMLLALDLVSMQQTTRAARDRRRSGGDVSRRARLATGCSCRRTSRSFTVSGRVRRWISATPGGLVRLPIVGVIVDYSDQQGDHPDRSLGLPAVLEGRLGQLLQGVCRRRARMRWT